MAEFLDSSAKPKPLVGSRIDARDCYGNWRLALVTKCFADECMVTFPDLPESFARVVRCSDDDQWAPCGTHTIVPATDVKPKKDHKAVCSYVKHVTRLAESCVNNKLAPSAEAKLVTTDIPDCFRLVCALDSTSPFIDCAPFLKAMILMLCRVMQRPQPIPVELLVVVDALNALVLSSNDAIPSAFKQERAVVYSTQGWTRANYPVNAPQLCNMVEAFGANGGVELFISRIFQQPPVPLEELAIVLQFVASPSCCYRGWCVPTVISRIYPALCHRFSHLSPADLQSTALVTLAHELPNIHSTLFEDKSSGIDDSAATVHQCLVAIGQAMLSIKASSRLQEEGLRVVEAACTAAKLLASENKFTEDDAPHLSFTIDVLIEHVEKASMCETLFSLTSNVSIKLTLPQFTALLHKLHVADDRECISEILQGCLWQCKGDSAWMDATITAVKALPHNLWDPSVAVLIATAVAVSVDELSEDAISPPPALSFAILTLVNDLDIPLPCVKALVDHVVSALATHPILRAEQFNLVKSIRDDSKPVSLGCVILLACLLSVTPDATPTDALALFSTVLDSYADARCRAVAHLEKLCLKWPVPVKLPATSPWLPIEAVTEYMLALDVTLKRLPELSEDQAYSLRLSLVSGHVFSADELLLVLAFWRKHFSKYDKTDIESMKISSLTDWCTYKLLLEAQFAEVKVDPGRSDSMFKSIKGLYTLLDAATQVADVVITKEAQALICRLAPKFLKPECEDVVSYCSKLLSDHAADSFVISNALKLLFAIASSQIKECSGWNSIILPMYGTLAKYGLADKKSVSVHVPRVSSTASVPVSIGRLRQCIAFQHNTQPQNVTIAVRAEKSGSWREVLCEDEDGEPIPSEIGFQLSDDPVDTASWFSEAWLPAHDQVPFEVYTLLAETLRNHVRFQEVFRGCASVSPKEAAKLQALFTNPFV